MTRVTSPGKSRVGLIRFPGSNCDLDVFDNLHRHFGLDVLGISHQERELPGVEALILPGGFSYGDYLRGGALASHAPVMTAVRDFAARGGAVIGICNGFQVLTETRLLPGALLANASRRFVCRYVNLASDKGESTYQTAGGGSSLRVPVAHGEGRYYIDADGLTRLEDRGQIAYRYVDGGGRASDDANPNGSVGNVAGVVSENGRIMGLMPHPERATDKVMGGSEDGLVIWKAFFASFS